jgi:hypothetical protein
VPFLVAVRLHELSSYIFNIFILRQWKTKVGAVSENDADEVETFLKDLQQLSKEQIDATPFLERLAGLSVGPIRSLAAGSCSGHDLDQVVEEYFDETVIALSWQEYFTQII